MWTHDVLTIMIVVLNLGIKSVGREPFLYICRVVKCWNRLPLALTLASATKKFQKILDYHINPHCVTWILCHNSHENSSLDFSNFQPDFGLEFKTWDVMNGVWEFLRPQTVLCAKYLSPLQQLNSLWGFSQIQTPRFSDAINVIKNRTYIVMLYLVLKQIWYWGL